MKSWKQPTSDMIEKVLKSVKKETDRQYFFSRLKNPLWISSLQEKGYFQTPPGVKKLPNGYVQYPFWPELSYLESVAEFVPDQVATIIKELPKTENPRIYEEIIRIALKLEGDALIALIPKIKEYIKLENTFLAHRFPNFIQHLVEQDEIDAAIEIITLLVSFKEDPKAKEKLQLRKENPESWGTSLEPGPIFQDWEYQEILEKGVLPLAELEPFKVAEVLIKTVERMIQLGKHLDEPGSRKEDYSEIWCRRLDKPDADYQDNKGLLVQALTFACKKTYEKFPDQVQDLDDKLRAPPWGVFKRLRQLLYSNYLNEQTLPWVRELILEYEDYSISEYHYEFQVMVRKACEYFGEKLLSEEEKQDIFQRILNGPSKERFRDWLGDDFSEESFDQRRKYFHRKQFHPFQRVLDAETRNYFDSLESEETEESVSDENYYPVSGPRGGVVSYKSPKSVEELSNYPDAELLAYLNEWDDKHKDKNDWLIEINIPALADAFNTIFKDWILNDPKRLSFWMQNKDNVQRPIYITSIVKAIKNQIEEKEFENFDIWMEFCEWVLTHLDCNQEDPQQQRSDESSEHPDWRNSRRAVVDLLDVCVNKDTKLPISARDGLARLYQQVCLQFDWRLDRDNPVFLSGGGAVSEAINNTRSRALESLINFGFWIRGCLPDDGIPELIGILDQRLDRDNELKLSKAERAMLGLHFGNLCVLEKNWAIRNKNNIFPQDIREDWIAAFESYICYSRPSSQTFELLRVDFDFALENFDLFFSEENSRRDTVEKLGEHLFRYYLWEQINLNENGSLLDKYYDKTREQKKYWSQLFNSVGRSLRNTDEQLEGELRDRVVKFFEWRLVVADPSELKEFAFWLDAECLSSKWRLDSYLKILEIESKIEVRLTVEMRSLNKLLSLHPELVVSCFSKIVDKMNQDSQIYLLSDEAKKILSVGLGSEEASTRELAQSAREKLLRLGRFDFMEI